MTRALRSLAVVLVVVGASGCYRSTGSTEVGIKIGKLFGADEVVAPGRTVLVIPVVHDWYIFDTKTQTVEMKDSKNAREDDALDFKTRDGNDVSVDVTVLYHVDPAKAPHVLRHVARDVDEVRDVLVRPLARSIPRDSLNELSSEEFYDSDLRAAKEEQALANLRRALDPYGLVCERVVLGNYRFHKNYQAAIDQKKVADQTVNKNRSAAEAAIKEWERELETTKGVVGQLLATERGKAQQVTLQTDAYYEARKLEADAIVSEKAARAQGITKMKEAMSGAGGRTMVKLRIAEALKGKRIVQFPTSDSAINLQQLDVNRFLEAAGVAAKQ